MAKVAENKTVPLIVGDFPIRSKKVIIESGAGVLAAGTVLGEITASSKHVLSDAAADNGSQTEDCILVFDVDATGADVETEAYISGDFNTNAMTFGPGHTAESVAKTFGKIGMYLQTGVPA